MLAHNLSASSVFSASARTRTTGSVPDGRTSTRAALSLVRHSEANETYVVDLDAETAAVAHLQRLCERFGTHLEREGDELVVTASA